MIYCEGTNTIYQIANPKIMNMVDTIQEVLREQIGEHSKLMDGKNEYH